MSTADNKVQTLEQRRAELTAKLAQVGDLRPGSLVERYRRCGKAGCHCAARGAEGHGPSWSLTREVGGKTVTRVIPTEAVARTRQHVAEYRRFRGLVREMVETSEQLCDARLDAAAAASDEEAQGGSPKGLRRGRRRRDRSARRPGRG